jgi:hypothetical protein
VFARYRKQSVGIGIMRGRIVCDVRASAPRRRLRQNFRRELKPHPPFSDQAAAVAGSPEG